MRRALILIFGLCFLGAPLQAQEKSAAAMLSAAIYEEEVSGNLEKAIGLYQEIIKKYPDDKPIVAKAMTRLETVRQKMGKPVAKNFFTDPRDGHKYRFVTIGAQTWMAENLAYLPRVSAATEGSETNPRFYVYGYLGTSLEEAKNLDNYKKYGVLYNWPATVGEDQKPGNSFSSIQGACPAGWHVPVDMEWMQLLDYAGPDAGKRIESLPGGRRINEQILTGQGSVADFAALAGKETTEALFYEISNSHLIKSYASKKSSGFSIRCVKDYPLKTTVLSVTNHSVNLEGLPGKETGGIILNRGFWCGLHPNPTGSDSLLLQGGDSGPFAVTLSGLTPETVYYARAYAESEKGIQYGNQVSFRTRRDTSGTFLDERDGREYKWIRINSQDWMAENLAWLPEITHYMTESDTVPCYYVFGYRGSDLSEAKRQLNYKEYGALYNWPAAIAGTVGSNSVPSGIQGPCPSGWHLPSDKEWQTMEIALGMTKSEADSTGYRKSARVDTQIRSVDGWRPGSEGDGFLGFDIRPVGGRGFSKDKFEELGTQALFWTSTGAINRAVQRILSSPGVPLQEVGVLRGAAKTGFGFSIRCIRNN